MMRSTGKPGKCDNLPGVIKTFHDEPVFRLVGMSDKGRIEFVEQLSELLGRRGLTSFFAPAMADLLLIAGFLRNYDIVLVDETCDVVCREIIAVGSEQQADLAGSGCCFVDAELTRLVECVDWVVDEHAGIERSRPVWACVLIGGKSSRMGRPKHLLPSLDGRSWLERSVEVIAPFVHGLVVSGAGELPASVASLTRLPDIPGIHGPMSGLLAASRWQPRCSWLVAACDMPLLSEQGMCWLLENRRPGSWGRIPKLSGRQMGEPLFAWYDCRGIHQFERLAMVGDLRVGHIGLHDKMEMADVPIQLESIWKNINTPDELGKIII